MTAAPDPRPRSAPGPASDDPAAGGPSQGTVVVGVGSPLMGDDGLGLAALESLRDAVFEPHVEMLDGGTWGMNLLPHIEAARRMIILDAVVTEEDGDGVVRLEGPAIPRFLSTKLSPHQIDLREVLALADLRGTLPPDTVVLGLRPVSVDMRAGLSPELERAVPDLVDAVVDELARWGHRPVASAGAGGDVPPGTSA